ncbi:MAG: ABC transporter permease [Bacteroidota bacterium]
MITSLIWRNLWRNKRRSLITMTSVSFAIMLAITMKSLQKGVFDNLVQNVVGFYSGYYQVHKKGFKDEQILDNSFIFSVPMLTSINKTNNVSGTAARIESFSLVSSGSTTIGCMIVGTHPEWEKTLTGLHTKIIAGNYITEYDNSVILSEGLAERLKISVHDTIVLLGQGYQGNTAAGKYAIKGIAHFGSPQLNESLVFLPLLVAQKYLSAENRITTLAVNINKPKALEEIGTSIKLITGNEYEVLNWKEMMPDIDSHIRTDNANFYIFIGVLYLLIAFGIFGTVLMMLSERKYELGMLIAIGMSKFQVAMMIAGETILISIFGTIAGLLISFPVVKYFEVYPIQMSGKLAEAYENFGFEAVWPAVLDFNIFITQAIIVLSISLFIGIFPLTKVYRMNAVTAMKR